MFFVTNPNPNINGVGGVKTAKLTMSHCRNRRRSSLDHGRASLVVCTLNATWHWWRWGKMMRRVGREGLSRVVIAIVMVGQHSLGVVASLAHTWLPTWGLLPRNIQSLPDIDDAHAKLWKEWLYVGPQLPLSRRWNYKFMTFVISIFTVLVNDLTGCVTMRKILLKNDP